jgi:hypothetical protein
MGSDKEEVLHLTPESQSPTLSPQPRAPKDGMMHRHQLIGVFTMLTFLLPSWRHQTGALRMPR